MYPGIIPAYIQVQYLHIARHSDPRRSSVPASQYNTRHSLTWPNYLYNAKLISKSRLSPIAVFCAWRGGTLRNAVAMHRGGPTKGPLLKPTFPRPPVLGCRRPRAPWVLGPGTPAWDLGRTLDYSCDTSPLAPIVAQCIQPTRWFCRFLVFLAPRWT